MSLRALHYSADADRNSANETDFITLNLKDDEKVEDNSYPRGKFLLLFAHYSIQNHLRCIMSLWNAINVIFMQILCEIE